MTAGYRRSGDGPARLDWSRATVADSQPCVHCHQGAILRHPITGRPMHKTCDDQRAAAEHTATEQRLTRQATTNRAKTGA